VIVPPEQRAGRTEKHLVLFGDLMAMDYDTPPVVDTELRSLFNAADLVLGNVEAPIYEFDAWFGPDGGANKWANQFFNFHASTGFLSSAMSQFCIKPEKAVFTVANNHANDWGRFATTVQTVSPDNPILRKPQGVLGFVGVAPSRSTHEPSVKTFDIGDLRVGVTAWTHVQNASPSTDLSKPTWEGSLDIEGATSLRTQIAAKQVDLMIGMPHWDCQFNWYPHKYTMSRAQAFADQGFDLIVGSHPSVLQPAARLSATDKAKLVFYSLAALNDNISGINGVNFLVPVVDLVVDQNGNMLQFELKPFVAQKLYGSDKRTLPSQIACGAGRITSDVARETSWRIVPLSRLVSSDLTNNGGTSLVRSRKTIDADDYAAITAQLNTLFPVQ
jgi:hypothetical protein